MSAEELKALERRSYEEMNKKNLVALSELYANDFVAHTGVGGERRGLEEYKKYVNEMITAFPDFHFTVHDILAESDKVVVRWTLTGTHKGEFSGIPPTNKKVTVWGIDIDRVAGGKFVEGWCRFDTLGMMQQLGLILGPK
jgi:steroid delta-isomerase-like uncharacterized protein